MEPDKTAIPESQPICCLAFLPRIVHAAKACGYALTVHGTLARDYDFVAVPWTEQAREPEVLVREIMKCCGGFFAPHEEAEMPRQRPHGRLCWSIHLGAGPYIDLSVMPPQERP